MSGNAKTLDDPDWWKHACDESPYAIAFVRKDDVFLWVNDAWSKLTGYPSSSLVGVKRWQDITAVEDVGADEAETQAIKDGDDSRYYCEKTYVKADGSRVNVGILVHRHPPFGPHGGYVVFARPTASAEYLQLVSAFGDIEREVTILQEARRGWTEVERRVERLESSTHTQLAAIQATLNALIGRQAAGGVSIGGGFTGGDSTGRDKNSAVVVLITVLGVLGLGALVLGGYLVLRANGIEVGQ